MAIKIALAGNPNCGKTTMFNDLTGSSQYVGNWPGVTVEKKEGRIKGKKDVILIDLPGIYSLSPYTLEEVVTRNYLIEEKPDVIINIIDATNLERNLYLTTQLLETGIPVVVALNMMDIVNKNGDKINIVSLSKSLGCDVMETSALKGTGLKQVVDKAVKVAEKKGEIIFSHNFCGPLENTIDEITRLLGESAGSNGSRWFAVKVFERDKELIKKLDIDEKAMSEIENIIGECEDELEDDAESIVISERYIYIDNIIAECFNKKKIGLTTSDKIDRIVTNRLLALPIFAVIMWAVYFIAVSSVGAVATDWINDIRFGEIVKGNLLNWLSSIGTADWLISLVIDGIIGGVGSVLGFVPQIIILFFLISILEDCGYMARVAFIMDRIFRKFGLSGKSFIPMLIGTGCSVPAVMSSRTIENEKDRKMTIILTPFIPCSAKLPIFALMIGIFFPDKAWVGPSMYFMGILMAIISGIILKHTPLFSGEPSPFVMELPKYHLPSLKGTLVHVWDRSRSFITKAGTVIFLGCAVIWFLQSFNWSLKMVDAGESMLATIGNFIAPIFVPLGFGTWQASVATLTGSLAKENVVASFGILFGVSKGVESSSLFATQMTGMFTFVSAYAFMVFNLLAAPCIAAIGAIKREMGGWKWTFIALFYQTSLAYIMALIINQIGSALIYGTNIIPAISISTAIILFILWFSINNYNKNKLIKAVI